MNTVSIVQNTNILHYKIKSKILTSLSESFLSLTIHKSCVHSVNNRIYKSLENNNRSGNKISEKS